MSEFIEILSPSALKDLQTANSEVLMLIKNIDNAGKSMQNIKTPSGSDSAIKDLNAKLIQQEKAYTALQIQLERYAQAQNRTKISNNALEKSEISLEQSRIRNEKALDRETAKLEASQQLYNKVQQKLNALSNEYKNLAVKKELSGKLTDAEAKRYDFLSGKITKYDATLKAVDASMGKYQRNVGNYSSAFNPLSNSINQLTREMPAFANSVQTGFMAISNNLPIFFDAISGIQQSNQALRAEGKPTQSVLSQLAGSLFSWGTALSVGVTLLTIYGKDIVAWAGSLMKGKEAIDSTKESQLQLNDVNAKGQKNAVEETLRLKSLLAIAKDANLSYKERMIAVNELQQTYPAYLGNLSKEQILAGNTAKAERELTDAILSRAKANAAVEKITENQAKIIDIDLQKLDLQKQLDIVNKNILATEKEIQQSRGKRNLEGLMRKENAYGIQQISLTSKINDLIAEENSLNKVNQTLTTFALQKQKESILLDDKEIKSKKNLIKTKKEEFKADPSSLKAMEEMISKLKEQQAGADLTSERYSALGSVISLLEETYNGLVESMKPKETLLPMAKGVKDLTDETKLLSESSNKVVTDLEAQRQQQIKNAETLAKLKQATDSFIASFSKGFLSSQGLGAFDQFFDGTFQQRLESLKQSGAEMKEVFALYFESIAESAQQTFNKIFELSNQRFENEKANLQKEKDIAIAFAGDSASAKEEINRQYDERQREIRTREAKAKKQQAIFNIIIDTAQGVVSALASGNIPLSIAIGVIGALQAGIVASQPTPQFYKGTDNAPEGWAWTQEKGAEVITDKNGKLKSTGSNKGAQMTYLNKGDKVFTAEKSKLMFDNGLNNILSSNGISGSKIEVNTPNIDVSGVIKAIENKASVNLSIDKGGLNAFVSNGHSRKEITNRRINGIGQNV
jgi:hypothetical protein